MLQISRQSIKTSMSYNNFNKCCKKYEENKTNFEDAYLGNSLVDSAQIWHWRCATLREFRQKITCVFVQGVSSYEYVKTAFSLLL